MIRYISIIVTTTALATPSLAQDTHVLALRCNLQESRGGKEPPNSVDVTLQFDKEILSVIDVEDYGSARYDMGQVGMGNLEAWAFFGLTGDGPVMMPDQRSLISGFPDVKRYETVVVIDRFTAEMTLQDEYDKGWNELRIDASYRCSERQAVF
jgi:hypothetical protein